MTRIAWFPWNNNDGYLVGQVIDEFRGVNGTMVNLGRSFVIETLADGRYRLMDGVMKTPYFTSYDIEMCKRFANGLEGIKEDN